MKKQILICLALVVVAGSIGFFAGNFGKKSSHASDPAPAAEAKIKFWTCSMHPQIQQSNPGLCKICAMELIPVRDGQDQNLGPRELKLNVAAAKLADVEIVPVTRRMPVMNVRMVGKIEFDESRLSYITARFPGRIDRLYVDYTGVSVKKGDHLASIYSPELLTAQQALVQAKRIVDGMSNNVVASMRDRAETTLQSAREKLRLWDLTPEQIAQVEMSGQTSDHVEIKTLMSGVVIHKKALHGVYLRTGDPIYTIADLSQVWVKLDAYESDLQWIHYGQEVEFETEAYPGEKFTGRINFRDPVLNPKTRTVKVRVNVSNKDGRLKPDMFVRAVVKSRIATGGRVMDPDFAGKWISPMHPEIVSDKPGQCTVCGMDLVPAESLGYTAATNSTVAPLVIPASAPLITGERAVVYVTSTNTPGIFAGREITLGPRAGDVYLVNEGLKEGELIVARGSFKIDSAIQILAKPSMMNPEHDHSDHATSDQSFTENTPEEFKGQLHAATKAYVAIKNNLSSDKKPGASQIQRFKQALTAVDMSLLEGDAHMAWLADLKLINKGAKSITADGDIAATRKAFENLSNGLIAANKKFGRIKDSPVYIYHCPMAFDNKGASWLQDEEGLLNPYFGSKMLRCGELKGTIEGHGNAGAEEEKPESAPAPRAFREQLDKAIIASAKLQSALAADKQPTEAEVTAFAKAVATIDMKLLTGPGHMDWMKQLKGIQTGIDRMQKADGIAASRVGYESVSIGLIAALKKFGGTGTQPFYIYHCPMAFEDKGASWLQDKEGLLNPYFGSQMLRCGKLQETMK